MNLDLVQSFYWVATLKSITEAAKKMCVTQQAMTARMNKLEEELGLALFDPRQREVRLTLAGARFGVEAKRLLEVWRDIKSGLGAGATDAVTLRLGANESVLHSWLIPWIERLRKENPALELELTVETTAMLLDLVEHGALDLVVATLPARTKDVRFRELPSLPMTFVGNRSSHRKRRYSLAELAKGELLTFQRGSQPHAALNEMLRRAGVARARIHAISSIAAMVRLVADGFGVALLPRAAIERVPAREGLRLLACEVPPGPLPLYASWHADPCSDAVEAFVERAFDFAGRPTQSRRHKKD
jgi:DNA-binding transcriptional LysR family regulator